ncbi:MAG: hypothetical protein V4692_13140, partial [Bdellovibrionota bacterium]
MSFAEKLALLKDQFAEHLCNPDLLKQPEGLATGLTVLDRFLVSSGIPKGALSLFTGEVGTGATTVWLDTAAGVVKAGRWVAWLNGETPLLPQTLQHKGIDLSRFVAIDPMDTDEKLFWVLQELMGTALFGLIGCDLGERSLKEHQLRKLQAQARDAQVSLVFITQSRGKLGSKTSVPALGTRRRIRSPRGSVASVYSLVLKFDKKQIVVERALHRPTPHSLARSVSYARFTHHLGSVTETARV